MRKLLCCVFALALVMSWLLPISVLPASAQSQPDADYGHYLYLFPARNNVTATPGTTITVRTGSKIDSSSLQSELITVSGSQTGVHTGALALARDRTTMIFTPSQPFAPGETVAVRIQAGIQTEYGVPVPAIEWQFHVSPKTQASSEKTTDRLLRTATDNRSAQPTRCPSGQCADSVAALTGVAEVQTTFAESITEVLRQPAYVTAPDFAPQFVVTRTTATTDSGALFLSPVWFFNPAQGRYLTIVDVRANLIYYQKTVALVFDFKRQPNGLLSYFDAGTNTFMVLDSSYQQVDSWGAGNGLVADLHDLQLLPNGNALLMIYDYQPLDLSSIGGLPNAQVIDLVIQEIDQDKNVLFQWNSRDHFAITDTYVPLNASLVDYSHGNAVDLDSDGNLLISNRHMSEITKINRATGDIIWRLGGKNNQFTFVGDSVLSGVGPFSFQHDIRRLSNGHVTLFDNGNQFMDANLRGSRGVEYVLDEANKTATLVKEFRTTPDVTSYYMGNMQRLPSGNTVIGWGGGVPGNNPKPPAESLTEFTLDGQVAFSAHIDNLPYVSYRAFRFPWQGFPTTPPALVAVTTTNPISLYYSWNGATEVVSYTVAGGPTPDSLAPFATQPKTGFEDSTTITGAPANSCFFQVTPMQKNDVVGLPSNIVYIGDATCPSGLTAQAADATSRTFTLPANPGPVTVTLSVEAGSVVSPTILVLLPSTAGGEPLPGGLLPIGAPFDLSVHDEVSLASNVTAQQANVIKPLELTLDYAAAQAPHPLGLRLVRWDAATLSWTDAGISLLGNDTVARKLTVQVDDTGTFALVTTNQAPTANGVAWVVTPEDTAYGFQAADFPYADADGDPLAGVTLLSLPVSGTLTLGGTSLLTGGLISTVSLGQLTYTPPANANGAPLASFGYTISDGFVAAGPYTATIQVLPVNDAPVAVDDVEPVAAAGAGAENAGSPQFKATVVVEVLGNDYDIDGDRLTITDISAPAHGTVARFGDAIQYTPNSGFTGSDEFTYTVADGNGGTATAKVRIADLADTLYIPLLKNSAR